MIPVPGAVADRVIPSAALHFRSMMSSFPIALRRRHISGQAEIFERRQRDFGARPIPDPAFRRTYRNLVPRRHIVNFFRFAKAARAT